MNNQANQNNKANQKPGVGFGVMILKREKLFLTQC